MQMLGFESHLKQFGSTQGTQSGGESALDDLIREKPRSHEMVVELKTHS